MGLWVYRMTFVIDPVNLRIPERLLQVMRIILQNDNLISVRELAEKLGVKPDTARDYLNRLKKHGLVEVVERVGKCNYWSLTPLGISVLTSITALERVEGLRQRVKGATQESSETLVDRVYGERVYVRGCGSPVLRYASLYDLVTLSSSLDYMNLELVTEVVAPIFEGVEFVRAYVKKRLGQNLGVWKVQVIGPVRRGRLTDLMSAKLCTYYWLTKALFTAYGVLV